MSTNKGKIYMIVQLRNKIPFIHLGFNKQSLIVEVGQEVTVWQSVIYNKDVYDGAITSTGITIVSEGLNKSVIVFNSSGKYDITEAVTDKDKTFSLGSNIISVNVLVEASNNTVTADSNQVLASGLTI